MSIALKKSLSFVLFAAAMSACAEESVSTVEGSLSPVTMTGTVSDTSGKPLQGAIITASYSASGIETSVFSKPDGTFGIALDGSPIGNLRIKATGYETVLLPTPQISTPANIIMSPASDPRIDLPSSAWLSLLPEGDMKREFILNCASCHEIGYPRIMPAGKARTEEQWQHAFAMMKAMDQYAIIPLDFDAQKYSAWLAEHLSAEKVKEIPATPTIDPEVAARLVITEYPLPVSGALPHDLVVGPQGRIWITGFFADQIWALDPATGAIESFDVDTDPDLLDQPRSLKFDKQGKLWVVNGGAEKVLRLDVATGQYESFDVGMYAHSLDLASNGDVWINDYFSKPERIARVTNPDGEVTVFAVPSANMSKEAGLPLPYGLQIDHEDRLWSTQLTANTLVGYDTKTGQSTLYQMPQDNSGPRRSGIGPDGALWIPEFNTGYLSRFEADTGVFQRFRIGPSSLGAYDVEIDQRTGAVWITGSLDSSLIRYQPDTGKVTRIPLPTQPAYMRHIAIDPANGDVWSAYSSLPAAEAKVVRLHFK